MFCATCAMADKFDDAELEVEVEVLKEKIYNFKPFPLAKEANRHSFSSKMFREMGPFAITTLPAFTVAGLALDIVLLPFRGSTLYYDKMSLEKAQERLQRLSRHGNPDSMLANAFVKAEGHRGHVQVARSSSD